MSEDEQIPFNNRTHDRLTELEKKFENRIRINPSRMVCVEEAISSHLEIIKKLEKEIDLMNTDWTQMDNMHDKFKKELSELVGNTFEGMSQLDTEIDELKNSIDYFKPLQNVNDLQRQIKELKESIKLLSGDVVGNLKIKEVLRELINLVWKSPKIYPDIGNALMELHTKLGGEKELSKRENGLNHTHDTGVGNVPNDSKPPRLPNNDSIQDQEEFLRTIENPSEQDYMKDYDMTGYIASSASHTVCNHVIDYEERYCTLCRKSIHEIYPREPYDPNHQVIVEKADLKEYFEYLPPRLKVEAEEKYLPEDAE